MKSKTRKKTTRHYHLRRVKSGIVPVTEHPMHFWGLQFRKREAKRMLRQFEMGNLKDYQKDQLINLVNNIDSDGDGVPDVADCAPKNPKKQDAGREVNAGNLVDFIMDYEGGNMSKRDLLNMFAYLIKTGQAWQLQGSIYGRPAHDLIEQGIITKDGKVNWDKVEDADEPIYDEPEPKPEPKPLWKRAGYNSEAEFRQHIEKEKSKYKPPINDTYYHKETPDDVIRVLENARATDTRIRVDYGDRKTGRSWGEVHDIEGYVGRSTGEIKIPLLIYNKRAMGGGALMDDTIVRIMATAGKRVLYQHPTYHTEK